MTPFSSILLEAAAGFGRRILFLPASAAVEGGGFKGREEGYTLLHCVVCDTVP
jgi:hypothetical protein